MRDADAPRIWHGATEMSSHSQPADRADPTAAMGRNRCNFRRASVERLRSTRIPRPARKCAISLEQCLTRNSISESEQDPALMEDAGRSAPVVGSAGDAPAVRTKHQARADRLTPAQPPTGQTGNLANRCARSGTRLHTDIAKQLRPRWGAKCAFAPPSPPDMQQRCNERDDVGPDQPPRSKDGASKQIKRERRDQNDEQ